MRWLLSHILLIFSLILGGLASPAGDDVKCLFSDVCPGDYWLEAVTQLRELGAVEGYRDGSFRPLEPATRAQLCKIIVVAKGWPLDTSGGPHFSDVPADHLFYSYVDTAYNRGVVSGYDDGTFRPYTQSTRGQIAKVVVAAEGWQLANPQTPTFADVSVSSPFYREIETAAAHGVAAGYADGRFRSGRVATRRQMAQMIHAAITPRGAASTPPAAGGLTSLKGIAGLVLDLSADHLKASGYRDGNLVVDWPDIAGWPDASGVVATAHQPDPRFALVYREPNGFPEVRAETASAGIPLHLPPLSLGAVSVFVVGSLEADPGSEQVVFGLGGEDDLAAVRRDGRFYAQTPGPWYSGLSIPRARPAVLAIVSDAAGTGVAGPGVTTYVDGNRVFRAQNANAQPPLTETTTIGFLGGRVSGQPQLFQGSIRRFLVFNRALGVDEASAVIALLARQYRAPLAAPTRNIIFDGDSLTVGLIGTAPAAGTYTDLLLARQPFEARSYNLGVAGQTVEQMSEDAAAQVDPLFDADLAENVVVAWAGTNDLALRPKDHASVYAALESYARARKQAGFKVVVLSMLPRGTEPGFESDRQEFNALVRANWPAFADALVDVGADARIGRPGAQNDPGYYLADAVHLSPAGHEVVAELVDAKLLELR